MPRSISTPDRLQSIADVLGLPVEVFFDEPAADGSSRDPSSDDLMLAAIAAAEAYMRDVQRKAQSVSLAGQS